MDKDYIVCKNCGTKLHKTMSACVKCGNEIKKPFYEKGVFWVCFVIFGGAVLTALAHIAVMCFFLWFLSRMPYLP